MNPALSCLCRRLRCGLWQAGRVALMNRHDIVKTECSGISFLILSRDRVCSGSRWNMVIFDGSFCGGCFLFSSEDETVKNIPNLVNVSLPRYFAGVLLGRDIYLTWWANHTTGIMMRIKGLTLYDADFRRYRLFEDHIP